LSEESFPSSLAENGGHKPLELRKKAPTQNDLTDAQ